MIDLPRGMRALTACQVRAARAMLMISASDLARRSEVSESTIRRIESINGIGVPENVTLDTLLKLQAYLERQGFEFTWSNGQPCVCWRDSPATKRASRKK